MQGSMTLGKISPSACASYDTLLTVVVPVFNEANTIADVLNRVVASKHVGQVIVVDDGSTDGTCECLEQFELHPLIQLLRHSSNIGKGAAIRTALEHVRGEFTIIQDADLEYDPSEYPRLLEPLLSGKAKIVYGSRYLHSRSGSYWSSFRWGVRLLNSAAWWLYGVILTDEATCYKVIRTDVLRTMNLTCTRFEFCPEVTAKACRLGLCIWEIPISYHPRDVHAGKKIRWRDGVEAVATLWKWRKWRP